MKKLDLTPAAKAVLRSMAWDNPCAGYEEFSAAVLRPGFINSPGAAELADAFAVEADDSNCDISYYASIENTLYSAHYDYFSHEISHFLGSEESTEAIEKLLMTDESAKAFFVDGDLYLQAEAIRGREVWNFHIYGGIGFIEVMPITEAWSCIRFDIYGPLLLDALEAACRRLGAPDLPAPQAIYIGEKNN